MRDEDFAHFEQVARDAGREAGQNAAAWWEQDAIGGRAGRDWRDVAKRTLEGIQDGDPAVLDSLPWPNLSGEWADDPTPATLAEDLGVDPCGDEIDDLCSTWEDASADTVVFEVERYCREALS